eukprot:gene23054-30245_t
MQQLSKMKISIVEIYNRKYVVQHVVPGVLTDGIPGVLPHEMTDVLPEVVIPQVVPGVLPDVEQDVVPGTATEPPRRDTYLIPVGLTEIIPPAGLPPDPGSQSASDEQTNNSNLCIVKYDDMAGHPDDHYAMPALLTMVNTITGTAVEPVLDSIVITPMYRITTGFFSVYEELLAMDNHAWNAGTMPWHPQHAIQPLSRTPAHPSFIPSSRRQRTLLAPSSGLAS